MRIKAYHIILLLICSLVFIQCSRKKELKSSVSVQVEAMEVFSKNIPVVEEWTGTTDGFINAKIRSQVTGYLVKQDYIEGDLVKTGQILFEIDPRPFEAALKQAEGALGQQEAQYENAKATLARVKPLVEAKALSPRDLDNAVGAESSARASVIAAKAAVEKSKLDLSFTKITSPIDGMAGIASMQVGDLVGPTSQDELTIVSAINPIKVYYSISEQAYIRFAKRFTSEREIIEQAKKLQLSLILEDGSEYPFKGAFYAFDRGIDIRTGTLKIVATFQNPYSFLKPGQFVRIRVEMGSQKAILIPQRAVNELQGGFQVAVIDKGNRIQIRTVKVGEKVDSYWVIQEGLTPGERVVVEGIQKVKDGILVQTHPYGKKKISEKSPPPLK